MEASICGEPVDPAVDFPAPKGEIASRTASAEVASSEEGKDRASVRARFAPWQTQLAKDMMLAQTHRALSLTDIADRLGVSVNHFIRAFRSTVGITPYQWFLQRRIEQSLIRLRTTDLAISAIAIEYGFADQSHFTKAFTRVIGISPGRWRRRPSTDAASEAASPGADPSVSDTATLRLSGMV